MNPTKTTKHGSTRWCADARAWGQGRRFFADRTDAERWLRGFAEEDALRDQAWSDLPTTSKAEVIGVWREVDRCGLTLRRVWDGYRESVGVEHPQSLQDAITALLIAKEGANRRPAYLRTLGGMLRQFAAGRESASVAEVTTSDVEAWLRAAGRNSSSRATWLNRLNTLFSFAIRRGWRRDNPCVRVERVSVDRRPPDILTVEQAQAAMDYAAANPQFLAWLTLALFAGLRPEECDRTCWRDIDTASGVVTVSAATSKVRWRRLVYMQPNAVAWLRRAMDRSDLPLTQPIRRRHIRALRGVLGFKAWPKDILRHTAASMLLAKLEDAPRVAELLGNSVGILRTHYRELVSRETAERFWAITPLQAS